MAPLYMDTRDDSSREDAFDLVFLAALEHLDLVVDFHDLLRLDEHGCTGGRGIVHQTGHIAAVLHLDRHNEAARFSG